MQIAINIILFVLGFTFATAIVLRPRKARKNNLSGTTSYLSQVTIDNETKTASSQTQVPLEPAAAGEVARLNSGYLFTKYVCTLLHCFQSWHRTNKIPIENK